jgi:hypothetical protein
MLIVGGCPNCGCYATRMESELILLMRPDGRLVAKPLDQATPHEVERAELLTKQLGEGPLDPEMIRHYLHLRMERMKEHHGREAQELQREFESIDNIAQRMGEANRQIAELRKRYPSCRTTGEVIRAAHRDGLLSD